MCYTKEGGCLIKEQTEIVLKGGFVERVMIGGKTVFTTKKQLSFDDVNQAIQKLEDAAQVFLLFPWQNGGKPIDAVDAPKEPSAGSLNAQPKEYIFRIDGHAPTKPTFDQRSDPLSLVGKVPKPGKNEVTRYLDDARIIQIEQTIARNAYNNGGVSEKRHVDDSITEFVSAKISADGKNTKRKAAILDYVRKKVYYRMREQSYWVKVGATKGSFYRLDIDKYKSAFGINGQ